MSLKNSTTIRKIELKKGASSAKIEELWKALLDMRRRSQWAFFKGLLSKLLSGTPEEVKSLIDGTYFEKLAAKNRAAEDVESEKILPQPVTATYHHLAGKYLEVVTCLNKIMEKSESEELPPETFDFLLKKAEELAA